MKYPRVGVSAIVTNEENDSILLGKILSDNIWRTPGGRLKFGENLISGLNLELDTQLNAKKIFCNYMIIYLGFSQFYNKEKHWITMCYEVRLEKQIEIVSNEREEWKWFSKDNLYKLNLFDITEKILKDFEWGEKSNVR